MALNQMPQRALRGHMPQRLTPRAASTGEHHAMLAGRLTHRDRWLARMLYEHRVLTTAQIVDLCYPTARAANHRLLDLFKWRVVDRFQPFVGTGTAPMHYVLDVAGAVALAYEDGIDPKQLGYRHEDSVGIAHSLRLAHTVGTNGFFTSLVAEGRREGARGQLTTWWSETRCRRLYGDMVRPDGYGRWRENGRQVEFFLEFDFGTETLGLLASKLSGYERLAAATGITTPVLVWFPTSRRENTVRRVLGDALSQLDTPAVVPVVTSAADLVATAGADNPATARWLPIDGSAPQRPGRLRFAELASIWPHPDTATSPAEPIVPVPGNENPHHLAVPSPLPPTPQRNRFQERQA